MGSIIEISDLQDPRLEDYRDLRDADLRGARKLFTVESLRVVRRFLRSGWPAESILLEPRAARELAAELETVAPEVPVYLAPEKALRTISGYGFHGGALALGRRPVEQPGLDCLDDLLDRPGSTIVAAEGVVHVDNMGSLFRNASCLGADAVLLSPSCADPLLRKTVRISSGRVFSLPWSFTAPWRESLERLKLDHGFRIIGFDTHSKSVSIDRMHPSERVVLLFGGEGHGLEEATIASCDQLCEIPVRSSEGRDEDASINVAVASAIALHERFRRSRLGDDLD